MAGLIEQTTSRNEGAEMHQLASELFPLHRSITGAGVRATFEILKRHIPMTVTEVPTGTKVFDWTIPQEWRIRDAFIADTAGSRVVNYADSNLHVLNYSRPWNTVMAWDELQPYIHTIPDRPDVIPYRTAYFRDLWGFCVNGAQYKRLQDGGPWKVVVDTEFFDGALTLAECTLAGASRETVVFHCHTCHPSLANDNLSGVVVATYLANYLSTKNHRYTYRFVFAPATIGAIAWLALQSNADRQNIRHGLVLTLLGDDAPFTYKKTRSESATIDRLVTHILGSSESPHRVRRFTPDGYDERQFGSPGIDLPIGRLSRSVHNEFPEYHTSSDNLEFVQPACLAESLAVGIEIVDALESNTYPVNRNPCGEPQLGQHGIFRAFGEQDDRGRLQKAMMWVLNLADGQHDLLSIAERSKLSFNDVARAAELLSSHDLVEHADGPSPEQFQKWKINRIQPD